jgi:hypothetical protein
MEELGLCIRFLFYDDNELGNNMIFGFFFVLDDHNEFW